MTIVMKNLNKIQRLQVQNQFKLCQISKFNLSFQKQFEQNQMANTIVQNCQRGIIFITFVIIVLHFIITLISLIKNRIDIHSQSERKQGEQGGQKYEQGGQKAKRTATQESADKIEAVIDASTVKEDDPTIIKIIKKYNQLMMNYFALLIVIPLNILTGTSKAFSFVFYFFILAVVLVFNVAKLHRKCLQHKCILVILDNIWIVMLFFELLNVWAATTTFQPYIVVPG